VTGFSRNEWSHREGEGQSKFDGGGKIQDCPHGCGKGGEVTAEKKRK